MNNIKKVLIIGFVWPEPQSSAAGSRMMQLVALFQSQGWEITFASASAESEHSADLESLGVETVSIEVNSSTFDDLIKDLQPDVVMFDRFVVEEQFGWRVAENCPDAVRVLDTEDLHCLRRARKQAHKENKEFTKQDLLSPDDAKREIASIYRSDLSLIISEVEMELLQEVFSVDKNLLQYVPYLLERIDENKREDWLPFKSRKHFMTIGNFQHDPNMDAVEFLRDEIWPRIRKQLPQVEIHIYGSYVNSRAEQMHNPENGFFIEGRAESAEEVIGSARVCLAPLRFGAGLKGKLVEAMNCGTPSVTTDIGAEGINGELPWSGEIANNPDDFAAAAVKLYTDKSRWMEAQGNGIRIINERFAKKRIGYRIIDRIKELVMDLENHRRSNFTGQMLMHHTAASTKYMSHWIEEKNKV